MQKAIVVAATALSLGAMVLLNAPDVVQAQAGPTAQAGARVGKHAGGKRLQKLAEFLGLTDAQKSQIKPLLKSTAQQAKAVRQDASLSPADKKAKIKSLRQGMRFRLLPILTPAQKQKLAVMRHNRGQKIQNA